MYIAPGELANTGMCSALIEGTQSGGKDAVECPVGQDARQAGEQCGVAGRTLSTVGHQQKRRQS